MINRWSGRRLGESERENQSNPERPGGRLCVSITCELEIKCGLWEFCRGPHVYAHPCLPCVCLKVYFTCVCVCVYPSSRRQFLKCTLSDIGWLLYNLTGLCTEAGCAMSHWLHISLVCCSADPYIGVEATWRPQSIAAALWSFRRVRSEGLHTCPLGLSLTFSKERWWRSSSFLMRN